MASVCVEVGKERRETRGREGENWGAVGTGVGWGWDGH